MYKSVFIILVFVYQINFAQDAVNKCPELGGYFVSTQFSDDYKDKISKEINFIKSNVFIFFQDGSVLFCNLGIADTDSINFMEIIQEVLIKDFYGVSWGKYTVNNGTLKVHFCYQFFTRGLKIKYYSTYFEGTLIDKHTITNWRMITPYPRVNKRLNDNFDNLKNKSILKFQRNEGVKLIHSKNAWINEIQ